MASSFNREEARTLFQAGGELASQVESSHGRFAELVLTNAIVALLFAKHQLGVRSGTIESDVDLIHQLMSELTKSVSLTAAGEECFARLRGQIANLRSNRTTH